jgi:hypothetical protein
MNVGMNQSLNERISRNLIMSFEEFWLGLNKAPIKVDCPPSSCMRH